MTVFYTVIDSPIDQITLTSDGDSLTGLYMELHKGMPVADASWGRDDDAIPFVRAREELFAYFAGTLERFSIPLKPTGTEFQLKVWDELLNIPFGQTISYGELACRVGNPKASRAVGLANGQNPISIIVPCHRVIGANGKLTGYGGGLPRKEFLLGLEGAAPAKQLKFA
ncbi:MAG: cysteine methyltransferase [Candidatus Melainabacteria bacterium]|nr:MAG: cysteine methyltransferase [Candidatus Melainabacteria bacterium]